MPVKPLWAVFIAVGIIAVALNYATHAYESRQSYKTGVYIGKAAFTAADYQDRLCRSRHAACEASNLNSDSAMEDALASANILPGLADPAALHSGFRDGWREARSNSPH